MRMGTHFKHRLGLSLLLLALFVLPVGFDAIAQTLTASVPNFTLSDQNNVSHELYRHNDKTAVVLFSYLNGCPIARKSIGRLKELRQQFKNDGVIFLFLNSRKNESINNVKKEATDYGIDFPILLDNKQIVGKSLGITRTAEAIVIEPKNWSVVYRGAIDDKLQYEGERTTASTNYLETAISELIAERPITIAKTNVRGCLITY